MKLLAFVVSADRSKMCRYLEDIRVTYGNAAETIDFDTFENNFIQLRYDIQKLETRDEKGYVLVGGVPDTRVSCKEIVEKYLLPEKPYAVRIIHLYTVMSFGTAGLYDMLSTLLIQCPQALLTVDIDSKLYRPTIHFHALASAVAAQVFKSRRG